LSEVFVLAVDDVAVARYVLDDALPDRLSPRPYLHPVTTLGGTVVTDTRPVDHDWHLGAGLAIPDVGGVNFWGGPTYVRGQGYVERDDHGRVEHVRWRVRETGTLVEDLRWVGPDGAPRLTEERTLRASLVATAPRCWALRFASALRNATGAPLRLGSPATNGRAGAGYGGFFWRAPASTVPCRIFSPSARGEAAVHGSRTPWVAFGGRGHGVDAGYTLVFAVPADGSAAGWSTWPWFVRAAEYPGVCSAIAFDREVLLDADGRLDVRVSVLVIDGAVDPEAVPSLVRDASSEW
jgi:hypothetical protein